MAENNLMFRFHDSVWFSLIFIISYQYLHQYGNSWNGESSGVTHYWEDFEGRWSPLYPQIVLYLFCLDSVYLLADLECDTGMIRPEEAWFPIFRMEPLSNTHTHFSAVSVAEGSRPWLLSHLGYVPCATWMLSLFTTKEGQTGGKQNQLLCLLSAWLRSSSNGSLQFFLT